MIWGPIWDEAVLVVMLVLGTLFAADQALRLYRDFKWYKREERKRRMKE